jgi:hypothetical protein
MGVSNGDEDDSGVDGDGSGGSSPSRKGAGTDTSVPRILSATLAELRNFSWEEACIFRVFASGALYGRGRWRPGGPRPPLDAS